MMKHSITFLCFVFICQFICLGQNNTICSLDSLKFYEAPFAAEINIVDDTSTICEEKIGLFPCYVNCGISSDENFYFDWEINDVPVQRKTFIDIEESSDIKLTILKKEPPNEFMCEYSFRINLIDPINVDYIFNGAESIPSNGTIDTLRICAENGSLEFSPDSLIYSWSVGSEEAISLDSNILLIDTNKISNKDILYIKAFSDDGYCSSEDSFFVQLINPPQINLSIDFPKNCNETGIIDLSASESYLNSVDNLRYELNNNPGIYIVKDVHPSFPVNAKDTVAIKMYYQNFDVCIAETKVIMLPENEAEIVLRGIEDEGYCPDASLNLSIENFEQIDKNSIKWSFNDIDIDFLDSKHLIDTSIIYILNKVPASDTLLLKILYEDKYFCKNEFLDTIIILKQPHPQLLTILESNVICKGEPIQIYLNSTYNSINWFFDDEELVDFEDSDTINIGTESLVSGQDYTYTAFVDSLGCVNSDEETFEIAEAIIKVLDNSKVKGELGINSITICEGSNNLYSYNNKLSRQGGNKIIEIKTVETNFYLHQWNEIGVLWDPNIDEECTRVEIQEISNTAPLGLIERFGTSTTLVYSDNDNSANEVKYRWFTIDNQEGFNLIADQKERTIDCEFANCNLEDNSQVIGLIVVHNNTQCVNVFMYNADTYVSVNEHLNQLYFNLYPTVNNGYIYVNSNFNQANGKLLFYNVKGEEIHSEKTRFQSKQFNFNSYKEGIYIAVLKFENKILAQQKFVIQ